MGIEKREFYIAMCREDKVWDTEEEALEYIDEEQEYAEEGFAITAEITRQELYVVKCDLCGGLLDARDYVDRSGGGFSVAGSPNGAICDAQDNDWEVMERDGRQRIVCPKCIEEDE